jgi:hypothetical protein
MIETSRHRYYRYGTASYRNLLRAARVIQVTFRVDGRGSLRVPLPIPLGCCLSGGRPRVPLGWSFLFGPNGPWYMLALRVPATMIANRKGR